MTSETVFYGFKTVHGVANYPPEKGPMFSVSGDCRSGGRTRRTQHNPARWFRANSNTLRYDGRKANGFKVLQPPVGMMLRANSDIRVSAADRSGGTISYHLGVIVAPGISASTSNRDDRLCQYLLIGGHSIRVVNVLVVSQLAETE